MFWKSHRSLRKNRTAVPSIGGFLSNRTAVLNLSLFHASGTSKHPLVSFLLKELVCGRVDGSTSVFLASTKESAGCEEEDVAANRLTILSLLVPKVNLSTASGRRAAKKR